jgi:hypothetical protein
LTVVEGIINVNKFTITGAVANLMAKALNDTGSNIGLAGTVARVTGAAKVLTKSARPPFKK